MKSVATTIACVFTLLACLATSGSAEQRPGASGADPRVGLKGGFRDAAEAARNMERVASLPKPAGFFNPNSPQGTPTAPERPANTASESTPAPTTTSTTAPGATPSGTATTTGASGAAEPASTRTAAENAAAANRLSFTNSDLAFQGHHLFAGNYHGFNIYDIESARAPKLAASIVCPGGQGDVSIYGNLLFMSVEQTRGRLDCGTQGVLQTVSGERFRGVRIFDITDLRTPKQVAAIQTCRGSHTHTLVTNPNDKANVYIYGSGTGTVRSAEELAGCSGLKPEEDPNTALFSIDVIQVPLGAPHTARIVNRPRIFADPATGSLSSLWPGGDHGPGTQTTRLTSQCHDITVFPEMGLAAGA